MSGLDAENGRLGDDSLLRVADRTADSPCGMEEAAFPSLGKCCVREDGALVAGYQGICPYCSVWSSLPEGANLETVHIIECACLGYYRRIKD